MLGKASIAHQLLFFNALRSLFLKAAVATPEFYFRVIHPIRRKSSSFSTVLVRVVTSPRHVWAFHSSQVF